jgi:Ran GTPase-activating protein (RanGAP) involved in mRNA processing and transport
MTRTITLGVPPELIGDFTEKLIELELENSITGKNDNEEILVEIFYEKAETPQIDELEAFLEEQKAELEEDEAEED